MDNATKLVRCDICNDWVPEGHDQLVHARDKSQEIQSDGSGENFGFTSEEPDTSKKDSDELLF